MSTSNKKMSFLIQYIIMRSDLKEKLNWPVGAVIAQACHATAAVLHQFRDDHETDAYLKEEDNMRTVVLEVKSEIELEKICAELEENKICFKKWIEQPENIPTCIALKPYVKNDIYKYLKHLDMYK